MKLSVLPRWRRADALEGFSSDLMDLLYKVYASSSGYHGKCFHHKWMAGELAEI
eukprot:COSAG03_NODE_3159_length_2172_cov_24.544621_1_plen_54_part_00